MTSLQELVKRLEAEGWTITTTGGGHLKMKSPKGAVVFAGSTLSDHRALRNIERDLKHAGWKPEAR